MVLSAVLLAAAACKGPAKTGTGECADPTDTRAVSTAEVEWGEMCAVCHGEAGQGGLGPALAGQSGGALAGAIESRMPPNNPDRCTGECATRLADFISHDLQPDALACNETPPGRRQLRLLSRREYQNTIRDLLAPTGSGAACTTTADCGYREDCDAGVCRGQRCDLETFAFVEGAAPPASVHVAGSFNGWAQTPEAGWPLTRDPATGVWSTTRILPAGRHSYKLVVDGTWQADPRAPDSEADGFGGSNSVIEVACLDADAGVADLPEAARPDRFPFDNHAASGQVTAAQLDAYLSAAETIADAVGADLERWFVCETPADRDACVRAFVTRLGPLAFRRPLTDDEIERYAAVGQLEDDFAGAATVTLQALISSPHFLYRSEVGVPSGRAWQLTPWETASALSYMVWGSMPDAALRTAADGDALQTPDQREAQVRRLLADPRARENLAAFATQWLGVTDLDQLDRNPSQFPSFTADLRRDLAEEAKDFFTYVAFDSTGTYRELLTADYTFANAQLAAHYGIGGGGLAFERRTHTQPRSGILGQGGVLAVTAHSDQTSPTRRGLFVRRRVLCEELPPPPPDAGGVPEVDDAATTRERFEQHTADARCSTCHLNIDPIGFGFEHFDPTGAWRDTENGYAIDASGDLADLAGLGAGTHAPFDSLPQLGQIIADSEVGPACFGRQYLRFATGHLETLRDRCGRTQATSAYATSGRIEDLIIGTARADDFIRREVEAP